MKHLCLLVIGLLFSYHVVFAQEITLPPSPTAASLGKQVQFPSIRQNGLPDISIPLYTVQAGAYELPIGLSYHAAGVKVDQLASFVGMNWNLQGSGLITRSVRGIPDDVVYNIPSPGGGGPYSSAQGWLVRATPTTWDGKQTTPADWAQRFPFVQYGPSDLNDPSLNYENITAKAIRDFDYRNYDTEPDIFFVNLPTVKAKFVMDGQGTPRFFTLQDVKISYTAEFDDDNDKININAFTVTDASGNQYFLNKREMTTATTKKGIYGYNQSSGFYVSSSWEEDRTYASAWHLTKIITWQKREIIFDYHNLTLQHNEKVVERRWGCPSSGSCNPVTFSQGGILGNSFQVEAKLLKSIRTDQHQVDFTLDTQARQDLQGGRRLQKITIRSLGATPTKEFRFNYFYMSSNTNIRDFNNNLPSSYDCKRLFLSSVQERGSSLSKPPYQFSYDTSPALPPRGTAEQDHWGYYNDNGSRSMIPKLYVYPNESDEDVYRNYPIANYVGTDWVFSGADRSVNTTAIKTGSLTRITNPTRGHADYVFEPNTYWDDRAQQSIAGGGLRIRSITLDGNDEQPSMRRTYSYNTSGRSSGKLIYLPRYARGSALAINPNQPVKDGRLNIITWGFANETSGFSQQKLWDTFTERISVSHTPLSDNDGANVVYTTVTEDLEGIGKTVYTYHGPKTYETHAPKVQTVYVQGGRCPAANPKSSWLWGNIDKTGDNIFPFPMLSDDEYAPSDPAVRAQSYYGKDAKLKSRVEYDESNRKVREVVYNYQSVYKTNNGPYKVRGLKHAAQFVYNTAIPYTRLCYQNLPQSYAVYSYHTDADALLSQTQEKVYQVGTNNAVVTTTDFKYASGTPHVSIRKIKDSENQTRTTTYQYAQDFSGSNYGSQNLRAAHMHNVVVTQTNKRGSTTTSKMHNFYGKLSSGPVIKYRTDDYPNGGSTFIRTNYSYDEKGNLVQVNKSGNRPISYLWGYSGTLPVAQVEGLSYGDLKKILDNDSYIKGLYYRPPASESDKNYYITGRLNKLRGKLPNHALMTGYAYEPLFGVTREMAPDGTQMRYEYDGLGRISVIRDQDNYILQRYLYNYR